MKEQGVKRMRRGDGVEKQRQKLQLGSGESRKPRVPIEKQIHSPVWKHQMKTWGHHREAA